MKVAKTILRNPWRVFNVWRHAWRVLGEPVTPAGALDAVRRRMAEREETFLRTVEHTVFANPASPYRELLAVAGYDLPRVRAVVAARGLEGALEELRDAGVYVTVHEFKGFSEARRGGRSFRWHPRLFDNPAVRWGLTATSGGTRSWGVPSTISASNHRMGAEHLALALSACGLDDAPMAVWMSHTQGASLFNVLRLAAMRRPPAAWFTQFASNGRSGRALDVPLVALAARARGVRLPRPTHVPMGSEERLLRWTEGHVGRHCGVFTTPSLALRLALVAARRGVSLQHVTFITTAEPLTPVKSAAIHRVGARAFSLLGFSEFGPVSYGCVHAVEPDDGHVCEDAVVVIQRRRAVDAFGTEVDALLFTSVRPDARKILLNVETGDYAAVLRRPCGCPLERAGWTQHLLTIRSFEKLNAEGRLFFGAQLITLLEDILPRQFGGDPTDYQLVEQEDQEGFTRLSLVVHPRLGPLDESALVACVETTLRGLHAENARVMQQAGTVQVCRRPPYVTGAGKFMPLHRLPPEG